MKLATRENKSQGDRVPGPLSLLHVYCYYVQVARHLL